MTLTLTAARVSRTTPLTAPALAAISHGTSSLEGQRAVEQLVAAVAAKRGDVTVRGGFVDVQQPDVAATLSSIDDEQPAVVVPLLLSAGYHVHVDLQNAVRDTVTREATLGGALGPDDRLVAILRSRLREAGLRRSDHIVLACAGSSDARAVADCHDMGARLSRLLRRPVRVGFISAATPRLEDAVQTERAAAGRARVVVSTYLLAPGYFSGLAQASGADVVTEPLLRADQPVPAPLVELVLDRFDAATELLARG